ncbi:MAG: ACT domain-containing protein [Candidatus Caldarchaeum sp.]
MTQTIVQKPFDSPRVIYCGDRELYLFSVELVDRPGALAEAVAIFSTYGINIVSVYTTETNYREDRPTVEVNIVVDLTGKNVSAEQLAKSLNLLTSVKRVTIVSKQLPNILVDELHFPLRVAGDRAVIYRDGAYGEMIQALRRQLGAAGEALLYHVGLNIGKGAWKKIKEICGEKLHLLPKYIQYWNLIHSAARITHIEIDFEKKDFLIRAESVYECEIGRGHGKPFSNIFRGSLAGMLQETLGVETVVETKCIAAGDPYCEFVPAKKS